MLADRSSSRTYGVHPPSDEGVEDQFFSLCRESPEALAIYAPMRGGYELLYARAGASIPGFRPFAAVHTSEGYKAVDPHIDMWRPSPTATQAQSTAKSGELAESGELRAAVQMLPADTPLVGNGAAWESLFASFLDCGVVFDQLFEEDRVRLQSARAAFLPRMREQAKFIQRQDLIFFARRGAAGPESLQNNLLTHAAGLQARATLLTLPSLGPLLHAYNIAELTPAAQLGLMRWVSSARLVVYVPNHDGDYYLRTHERPGEPRGRTRNFAAAVTPHGWLPVNPNRISGFDDSTSSSYFSAALLHDSGRPFATLFDAYLMGGGVQFEVPTEADESSSRAYVGRQVDAFIWHWRAGLRLHSAATAAEWGASYATPIPVGLGGARATLQLLPSSAWAGKASERELELRHWVTLRYDSWNRAVVEPEAKEEDVEPLACEVDYHGYERASQVGPPNSPRPAARRPTWPGSADMGSVNVLSRVSASPERS